MAIIKSGNFSFKEPPFKNGDIVEGGNYSQLTPHTEICKNVTILTVNGGNFCNCKPQDGWILNGGNWCQIEFCTHDRPELIEKGLTPCVADCGHKSKDKIERDVDEPEYRKKAAEVQDIKSSITAEDLSIDKTVDTDGVTVQKFKVSEYEYKPSIVQKGMPWRGAK